MNYAKTEDIKIKDTEIQFEETFNSEIDIKEEPFGFQDDVFPEEEALKTEIEQWQEGKNSDEFFSLDSVAEENSKMIEDVNATCTRWLKDSYLLPLIKEHNKLTENPVSKVVFSSLCQENVNSSKVLNVDISLSSKTCDKSPQFCKSGQENHRFSKCKYYKYSSSIKTDLATATHIPAVDFRSSERGSSFSLLLKLKMHNQEVHNREVRNRERRYRKKRKKVEPPRCSECDYVFTRKSSLKQHIQSVHLKEKPFKCGKCGYSCSQKSALSTHIQAIHLTENPFRCTKCEYSCRQKGTLSKHIRDIHMKEEPFRCTVCEYSCCQIRALAKHVRLVHL